ncbi:MAG: beta-phosphoglucomutase family hydrolase [Bacteroidetes bacterium]|nr:beta-phosphoglucomutase family hydrolase [Bacteroidota bacterium]MBL6943142.1 beta-phosphoglucomutase family hydrolase [Bacteroidales bacterium]
MTKNAFEAVIFDLDGVITKTATTHNRAWKKMFDSYLSERSKTNTEPFMEFTSVDYLTYVDGKPRYEGVKSFLKSRKIELPFGTPADNTNLETICGLGNRKNEAFNEVLKNEGVEVYPSSVKLLEQLKKDGIRIGVASSSKNAKAVLETAGLMHFVETCVDGVVSAEMGLNGKPHPDIFLTAANNLGVDINKTIVVEDAVSGVQAGNNGNFGLVLGLAREDNNEVLKANGADIVVNDLEEITMSEMNDWFISGIENDNWEISYNDYIPAKEKSREALLTIGNGYFGTRGAMEESSAGATNYPGTYIAGLYNRLTTKIGGKDIENEDFVVAPNWLLINFKIDDKPWFDPNTQKIKQISRKLDFRIGLLTRRMIITDAEGRQTKIESKRIASMANPHQAAISYSITPLNYSGRISIASQLDGSVKNDGVNRYKDLNSQHLVPIEQGGEGPFTWLKVRTTQSKIEIVEAAKLRLISNNEVINTEFGISNDDGIVYTYIDQKAVINNTITLEKFVTIYDSNNNGNDIVQLALNSLKKISSFNQLINQSTAAWNIIWKKVDIKLTGDRLAQKMLRLHIYHLMVSASPNNAKIDASITARGLHGEAYRGHIFWDELFIMPFYDIHFLDTAKSMLMYRYKRLEKAREYALEYGYKGAMFPWQSGSDGREETQIIHLNPISGEWGDDYSSLQRHVSLAIAYNIWQYYNITNDIEFMEKYGAEMYLEICRFWESKTNFNKKDGRYSIGKVMGPDEFHESYPDAKDGGIRDNAYTNIMVAWMFNKALSILNEMNNSSKEKLLTKINLTQKDLDSWSDIRSKLNLVINDEGIIGQYDGYFELKELDWEYYRNKYKDIHRMDRLLKAEGKSADDYKVAKQADTLMTFYNLENEEINKILDNLNYKLPNDYLPKNLRYYLERTSHGSTLSRVVHAQLANIINDKKLSWKLYIAALTSDYNDIQGGTTAEGIHTGVMAGTVMIAISTYAGVDLRGELIKVQPNMPEHWKMLEFSLDFKKINYNFVITQKRIEVITDTDTELIVFGKKHTIEKDKFSTFEIDNYQI